MCQGDWQLGKETLFDLNSMSERLAAGHTSVDNWSSVDGRMGKKTKFGCTYRYLGVQRRFAFLHFISRSMTQGKR